MTGTVDGGSLIAALRAHGADLVTGVPCSYLASVVDSAIVDDAVRYVGAASEGEAVGLAAGRWLGGGSAVVLAQNSGLGNMVNPLTSLANPARIPLLVLCSWRGQPGLPDEPQHAQMGRIMGDLLDLVDVECRLLPPDPAELQSCVDEAYASMARRRLPYCLVVRKDVVRGRPLDQPPLRRRPPGESIVPGGPPANAGTRTDALNRVLETVPDPALLVATTGKTGRELFTLADRPQHFYLVGAMGCATSVGLGVALSTPRPVVVLDGDGASLMKLGTMATIGAEGPGNLVHVLLDNQVHDSTGGQRTSSGAISFPEIAIACGYRSATTCPTLADLSAALERALARPGPHLVHVRLRPGSPSRLGRPTVTPAEVAVRFREHVGATLVAAHPGQGG